MKKIFFVFALVASLFAFSAKAQNIQLHYDFGSAMYNDQNGRPAVTTTIEHFRPDNYGNTFYFVDMNYQNNKAVLAYFEIARELKFWSAPIALHLEYNGGLMNMTSFASAYLAGATYAYNASDYSYGFTLTPMYKHLTHTSKPYSAQLTGTWYLNFLQGKMTFSGFADLWGDREPVTDKEKIIFLTEPQIWLHLNKFSFMPDDVNLSVGGEVEVSHNFAGKGFYAIPTLALKWTF